MVSYSTHLRLLKFLMDNFDINSVVELGMGDHSTSFFRSYSGVNVVSVDSDINWVNKFKANDMHEVSAGSLLNFASSIDRFDLAFVDGNPANERAACVQKLLTKCRVVVAHDTEPKSEWSYGYNKIELPEGYIRIDDTKEIPWTSVYTADAEIITKVKKFLNEV